MTSRANQLLHDVLELTADERAAVAAQLLASLDADSEPTDHREIEAAWAEEIEHRARRVLAGESVGKPWDEVRRNIELDLGKR